VTCYVELTRVGFLVARGCKEGRHSGGEQAEKADANQHKPESNAVAGKRRGYMSP